MTPQWLVNQIPKRNIQYQDVLRWSNIRILISMHDRAIPFRHFSWAITYPEWELLPRLSAPVLWIGTCQDVFFVLSPGISQTPCCRHLPCLPVFSNHGVLYWLGRIPAAGNCMRMLFLPAWLAYLLVGKHCPAFFFFSKSLFIFSATYLIFTSLSLSVYIGRQVLKFFCQNTPASSFGWCVFLWLVSDPQIWLSWRLW